VIASGRSIKTAKGTVSVSVGYPQLDGRYVYWAATVRHANRQGVTVGGFESIRRRLVPLAGCDWPGGVEQAVPAAKPQTDYRYRYAVSRGRLFYETEVVPDNFRQDTSVWEAPRALFKPIGP